MEEVTTWRSKLGNTAIIHKKRVILHPLSDRSEACLLKLFDFLLRPVLHDAEIGTSRTVPLACLRSSSVLSGLHLADLAEGEYAMDLCGTAFQPADFSCHSVIAPCLHRNVARGAFCHAVQHIVVAFLTFSEGNGHLLGGDAIMVLEVLDPHLGDDTGLPSRVAALSFSTVLAFALSSSFNDLRVGHRRIVGKQIVLHLFGLDAFCSLHVADHT